MYDTLEIDGYRGLGKLELSGLKRVNLLLGKNNAGKTSVLEAVEALSGGGNWREVAVSCHRRGEIVRSAEAKPHRMLDLRHLFEGHQFSENARFRIEGRGEANAAFVEVSVVPSSSMEDPFLYGESPEGEHGPWKLRIESDVGSTDLPADRFVARAFEVDRKMIQRRGSPYVGTMAEEPLEAMWGEVVLTDEETRVVEAMQTIEPAVERIAFAGDGGYLKLAGHGERVPLGSMGEGTHRMVRLALHLSVSADSVLLLDEVDTGLHYTTLVGVWRLLIDGAERRDTQVFATTHSYDCLNALAEVCATHPELGTNVAVHRLEKGAPRAVHFSAEELAQVARHDIEIR